MIRLYGDTIRSLSPSELKCFAAIDMLLPSGKGKLSFKQLAAAAHVSVRTAQGAVATLCGKGYIHRYATIKHGKRDTTRYFISARNDSHYAVMSPSALSLTAPAFKLLAYLLLLADRKLRAYPSVRRLAASLGLSPDTVRRGRQELARAGFLSVEERYYAKTKPTHARRSNEYRLSRYGQPITRAAARADAQSEKIDPRRGSERGKSAPLHTERYPRRKAAGGACVRPRKRRLFLSFKKRCKRWLLRLLSRRKGQKRCDRLLL